MRKSLDLAIGNRPIGEQRGIAFAAGVQQIRFAYHVQEGFLLTSETGVGQVFCCGARADGDRDIRLARCIRQSAVFGDDLLCRIFWPIPTQNQVADGLACLV